MDGSLRKERIKRQKRVLRVRKKLRGDSQKLRLSVVKTNKHVYVQLINDELGVTVASTSTAARDIKGTEHTKKCKESAKFLGIKIAELGKSLHVTRVIFDRGAFKYHGIVAMVAEGAREAGLVF